MAGAPSSSPVATPLDLQRGVAVVAIDDAVDAAWALASRVYADPLLRPSQVDDGLARALAGEPLGGAAPQRLRELAQARKALKLDDPMAARMAASIAGDLGGANLLLVFVTPAGPRARLFLSSSRTFFSPDLWQQSNPEGIATWEAAGAWLHGHALAGRPQAQTSAPAKSKSLFKSGWFWGAIGAAATIGVVAATLQGSDSSDSIHVRGRIGP